MREMETQSCGHKFLGRPTKEAGCHGLILFPVKDSREAPSPPGWNLEDRHDDGREESREQAREYDADAGCTSARTSRMQRRPAPVSSGSYGGRATRRYSGTGLSARPSSPPTTSSGAARPPRRGIDPAKNPAAR